MAAPLGNTNGKRGAKLRRLFDEYASMPKANWPRGDKVGALELVIQKTFESGLEGDLPAAKEIYDRTGGKVAIELTGEDGGDINVNVQGTAIDAIADILSGLATSPEPDSEG